MKLSKRFYFFTVLTIVGTFFIALPFVTLAASDPIVVVPKDQIVDGNFVRAGSSIEIDGNIKGDVIVAGNSITINGAVAGDIIAAGNLIRINGPVGGSVRVVGGTIEITSAVERNVWVAGNTVIITQDASIGWDAVLGGATVEVKGPVSGSAWLGGATVTVDTKINKNVDVSLDRDSRLVLGATTNIGGTLIYHAEKDEQLVRRDGAIVTGEVKRELAGGTNMQDWKKAFGALWVFTQLFVVFSSILIGVILVSVVPKLVLEVSSEMINTPARSLGWGVVASIVMPVVLFLFAVTIIGLPLTLIGIPLFMISLYFAKIFAAFSIGLYILNATASDKKYTGSLVWPLVLGVILFVLLGMIPLLGWTAKFLVIMMAFGALIQVKRGMLREYR